MTTFLGQRSKIGIVLITKALCVLLNIATHFLVEPHHVIKSAVHSGKLPLQSTFCDNTATVL